MKINRLLEMTIILLNQGTVTAREFGERFGVSTRTIYRDIEVLSSAGVPVYTNQGNGGGIALLENYVLSKTLFSEQECQSLRFALKALQATKDPAIDQVLEKLGALFKGSEADDWITVDLSDWGSKPNERNKLTDIKTAIMGRRVVTFDYVNAAGSGSCRSIEPLRVIFKARAWYLWGYCRQRSDFRVFRISRIKNLVITAEIFQRRAADHFPETETGNGTIPLTPLKLRFMPQALHRVYDDFDEEYIRKNAAGECEVTIALPEDEWVYGYILSFGSFVEVIEPDHIRLIIADRMRQALRRYDPDLKI